MTTETFYADRIPSPLGDVWAVVNADGALVKLDFEGGRSAPADERDLEEQVRRRGGELAWSRKALRHVAVALKAYFRGDPHALDLEVALNGTPFQHEIWKQLSRIPFGQTISYAELAKRAGSPGAARAAGRANATNPVSLVVPCHRVIGSNGTLTGYGGGMERKEALLIHEGALEPANLVPLGSEPF